jgi:hypothetical protein
MASSSISLTPDGDVDTTCLNDIIRRHYKYVEYFISSKGRIGEGINNRVSVSGRLYFMPNHNSLTKEITRETKLNVRGITYISVRIIAFVLQT